MMNVMLINNNLYVYLLYDVDWNFPSLLFSYLKEKFN